MKPEPNYADRNFAEETHVHSRTARIERGLTTNVRVSERAAVLSLGRECGDTSLARCGNLSSMRSRSCEDTTQKACAQSLKGMAAIVSQRRRRVGILPHFCTATPSWGGAGIYRPHRGVTVAVCSDGVTLDRMNTEAGAVGAERVCTVAPSAQAGEKEYSTCAW